MSTTHSPANRVSLAGRVALGALFLTLALSAQDGTDPPSRVARLNLIDGPAVSMQPAGSDQWVPAVINRPFTIGDYIFADPSSRAELHFDSGVLRIGPQTSVGFLNFNDGVAQLSVVEGALDLHIRRMSPDDVLEVDTPNAAISITAPGDYRINVNPDDQTSFVVVRSGSANITGGGDGFMMQGGQSAQLSGTDTLAYNVGGVPDADPFDQFCFDRDRIEQSFHPRYVSREMIGYEDLDQNGAWTQQPGYGAVWYPTTVAAGWAPYRDGHWAWIEPWGWTWVDDAAWGFAPFHYGRWAFISGRWGWIPGPMTPGVAVRPVYAPALVAFFGGGGFSLSINLGGGPSLGWVPLGPGEYYAPAYSVSPGYFSRVNVSNTVITNVNITNIYNTTYVNRGGGTTATPPRQFANMQAPNAVTVMSQSALASGQPVSRAGQSLPKQDLGRIQAGNTALLAPPVAPTRQALALGMGKAAAAAHPPAQLLSKPVFAKATPPPPPISFDKKQQFLASHAGQPLNQQALRSSVPQSATPPAPTFRKVSPTAIANGQRNAPSSAVNARPTTVMTQPKSASPGLPPNQGANAAQTPPKTETAAPEFRRGTPPPATTPTKTTAAPEFRKVTPPPPSAPAPTTAAPASEVRRVTPPPPAPAANAAKTEPKPAAKTTAKGKGKETKETEKKQP
jgi:hypothetical protein